MGTKRPLTNAQARKTSVNIPPFGIPNQNSPSPLPRPSKSQKKNQSRPCISPTLMSCILASRSRQPYRARSRTAPLNPHHTAPPHQNIRLPPPSAALRRLPPPYPLLSSPPTLQQCHQPSSPSQLARASSSTRKRTTIARGHRCRCCR